MIAALTKIKRAMGQTVSRIALSPTTTVELSKAVERLLPYADAVEPTGPVASFQGIPIEKNRFLPDGWALIRYVDGGAVLWELATGKMIRVREFDEFRRR